MLCDHAQVAEGKLFIAGGGWNITNADAPSSALAVLFGVPWDRTNQRISFTLVLQDADGHVVTQPTDLGPLEVQIRGDFEVGRPPGSLPGTELEAPMAWTVPPLKLRPGQRYAWVLSIDGETMEPWRLAFSTRPATPTGN